MQDTGSHGLADHARLRVREVLELCAISRATLYKRLAAGTFPRPVKVAGSVRWAAGEIRQLLEQEEQHRG